MSFSVECNQIIFEQRCVGTLLPTIALGLRRKVEEAFVDFEVEGDVESRIKKAEEAAWQEGNEKGVEEGRAESVAELEKRDAEIEDAAFARGHAAGMAAATNASDAARVKLLLDAMAATHDRLLPIWLGFAEPGVFRRRPAKLSDAKSAAKSCAANLHRAINEYRAEPAEPVKPESIFA